MKSNLSSFLTLDVHFFEFFLIKLLLPIKKKKKKIDVILDKKLHLSVYLDIFTTDK